MLDIIFPVVIASIGFFIANLGNSINATILTAIGVIAIIVGALWLCYVAGYNIGYMLY